MLFGWCRVTNAECVNACLFPVESQFCDTFKLFHCYVRLVSSKLCNMSLHVTQAVSYWMIPVAHCRLSAGRDECCQLMILLLIWFVWYNLFSFMLSDVLRFNACVCENITFVNCSHLDNVVSCYHRCQNVHIYILQWDISSEVMSHRSGMPLSAAVSRWNGWVLSPD